MLLILEVSRATEIILAIIVFAIALVGIIAGWGEGSDGPKEASGAKGPPISSKNTNAQRNQQY